MSSELLQEYRLGANPRVACLSTQSNRVLTMTAFLEWWLFHFHARLFKTHPTVCLASSKEALTYTVRTHFNRFRLASFHGPDSPKGLALSHFHLTQRTSLRFCDR